ncbi:hypothetical protein ACTXT7_009903 [Hymenolepis weldensis]
MARPDILHKSNHGKTTDFFEFVVVGGGIAGVVCAETLCDLIGPPAYDLPGTDPSIPSVSSKWRVCLISSSGTLKTAVNVQRVTRLLESFDIAERSTSEWSSAYPDSLLRVIVDKVIRLDCEERLVYLAGRPTNPLKYGRICLATGGVPRAIVPHHPLVLTLRDTESVAQFRTRLAGARRVVLVGNGGIATEVAYEIEGCQVIWAVKHETISVPFLDPAAAQFLLRCGLEKRRQGNKQGSDSSTSGNERGPTALIRTLRYTLAQRDAHTGCPAYELLPASNEGEKEKKEYGGSALGPDWTQGQRFTGVIEVGTLHRPLKVVYKCQVDKILSSSEFGESEIAAVETDEEGPLLPPPAPTDWPVYVLLTNGECYGADFIISATGVEANFTSSGHPKPSVACPVFLKSSNNIETAPPSEGGGLVVNEMMQSMSIPELYAAGDCAYAGWEPKAPHWFQMRLWSQARQTAFQAAKSMFYHTAGDEVPLDFSFELFTHVTNFFGFKRYIAAVVQTHKKMDDIVSMGWLCRDINRETIALCYP